jgi:hypothetical protein
MNSLWTVLRSIHSVAVSLPSSKRISSTIIAVNRVTCNSYEYQVSKLLPVAKQRSVMDKRSHVSISLSIVKVTVLSAPSNEGPSKRTTNFF